MTQADMEARSERFWNKVDLRDDDECWPWKAGGATNGYGKVRLSRPRRMMGAHRVSYTLAYGPIPEGMHVCHTCDNPSCCNPRHLFAGTAQDNHMDKWRKGRARGGSSPGSLHPESKLTESQVLEMLSIYRAGGTSQLALAQRYGICQGTVSKIVRGEKWKHVVFRDASS